MTCRRKQFCMIIIYILVIEPLIKILHKVFPCAAFARICFRYFARDHFLRIGCFVDKTNVFVPFYSLLIRRLNKEKRTAKYKASILILGK